MSSPHDHHAQCAAHFRSQISGLSNSPFELTSHSRFRCVTAKTDIFDDSCKKQRADSTYNRFFGRRQGDDRDFSSRGHRHLRNQNKLGVIPTSASTRSINFSLSFSGALTARLTGWLFIFDAGNGLSSFSNTAGSVFASSQSS